MDNPSAFPVNTANLGDAGSFSPEQGMTLRDWFAGQALTTIAGYGAEDLSTWHTHHFAAHAYAIADAMLAERNKGK